MNFSERIRNSERPSRWSTSSKEWRNTYFAVTPGMVAPLAGIGITVSDHALYLTVTSRGAIRVVPVRQANGDGEQNEYDRTKETRPSPGH